MLEKIEHIDQQLLLFINSLHSPFLDGVMWQISHQLIWIPLFVFFLFYAYKKLTTKALILFLLGVGLCFLLADRLSVMAFKEVFLRYRPTHNLNIQNQIHTYLKSDGTHYLGGKYGFVSSHSANFFALSTFLYFIFKSFSNKWMLIFCWAALIGYSRIYLGVHYPLDVIGGGLLGIIIGFSVYKLISIFSLKNQTNE